ncbi:acyltransferase [Altererythrobacter sp. SALINAS58]|nr:acyltransferase [Alteripontixanthobacter muriae]
MDGLRGVAAIAVAVGHLNNVLGVDRHLTNSALAVDFFFMLSGFVLAHAYGGKLARGRWFIPFLIARVIRLYPLILVGALVGASAYLMRGTDAGYLGRLLFQSILLVPEIKYSNIDPSVFPINPPAWSLLFEVIASILFGLGVWRVHLLGPLLLFSAAALFSTVISYQTFDVGWSPDLLWSGLIRVMFGMGAGIFLYRVHCRGSARILPLHIGIAGSTLVLILSGVFSSVAFQMASVFLFFPLIILGSARASNRWIGACKWFGELSYPLYIIHWPVYLWIGFAIASTSLPIRDSVLGGISLITAIITSLMVLRLYDQPVRRWLTKRARLLQFLPFERFGAP